MLPDFGELDSKKRCSQEVVDPDSQRRVYMEEQKAQQDNRFEDKLRT